MTMSSLASDLSPAGWLPPPMTRPPFLAFTRIPHDQVEIKLKKAIPYQWADLCASSMPAAPIATAAAPLPTPTAPAASADNGGGKAVPPRPYASHRDWEAVEREITKELEGEKVRTEEKGERDRCGVPWNMCVPDVLKTGYAVSSLTVSSHDDSPRARRR